MRIDRIKLVTEMARSEIKLYELAEKSEKTSREIVDNWKKQQVALEKYAENMQKGQ